MASRFDEAAYRADCLATLANLRAVGQRAWFCDHLDWGCHGEVCMMTGPGRDHDGKPIPDDYPIYTCRKCGETYVSLSESEKLDEVCG